jgi:DNA-binding CsgD family transcriptional regulator
MALRVDQVSSLMRLLNETREHQERERFLNGLARIVNAQVAIRILAKIHAGAPPSILEIDDVGWATASDRDRVAQYIASTPVEHDPLSAIVLGPMKHRTALRAEVQPQGEWACDEVRIDVHRPAGIDDTVLSYRRSMNANEYDCLILKRAWGEPSFTVDERDLIDLVHTECNWVFTPKGANIDHLSSDLRPRERETLQLLLTGASEKSIAASLGVSPNTVHDYVKVIYRRLRVGSRAELMARALSGR